jgi:DNA mismatch endonuclease, patch repair protein
MGRIKNKNTQPEVKIRSIIHRMGFRFRLNRLDLPGKPDIVLPKYHKVIFVNGCFWHGHLNCPRGKRPTTNIDFWSKKLDANILRDTKNVDLLKKLGWDVLVLWQCELNNEKIILARINDYFNINNNL